MTRTSPTLRSLGFAVPPARHQEELATAQAIAWGLNGVERDRWERIVRGSGITTRHVVGVPEAGMRMSTAERMRAYESFAPTLALAAAEDALRNARLDASVVTDCVVVSCTGFMSPGVGAKIARPLGLRPTVRQSQVGFMGCFGGILGLRTALGTVAADPDAVVLVVCVELCSLHFRADCHPQQLVAAALFADGAAAAVIDGRGAGRGQLDIGHTLVIDEASEAMTWRIVDDGFMMTLNRDVPVALERAIGPWVDQRAAHGLVIHPGGPGILDAIERGVSSRAIDQRSFPAARAVLREYGNMSSGTILFVLDPYCQEGGALPVDLIAFGPGLTIDGVGVRPQE